MNNHPLLSLKKNDSAFWTVKAEVIFSQFQSPTILPHVLILRTLLNKAKEPVVVHHILIKDFDDGGIRWNYSTELQSPEQTTTA